MAIPKADRQLEKVANEVLAPGEHLVAAARALAVGAFEGRLGIFGELLTGAVMQSLLTGESVRRAHRAQFPAAPRMVIGVTDRRILVWKAALFSHKPVRFLGEVSLERLASVSVQPAVDRRRLTFGFVDASPVTVTVYKRDEPERFSEYFHQRVMAASAAVVGPDEPMLQPAPTDTPVADAGAMTPPLPAAPTIAAPLGVPAVAAATMAASAPVLPPPPPVPPGRPARPPARSWATALQQPAPHPTAADSAAAQGPADRKCMQCGTPNPEGAAFCWRCFVPFAEPSLPRPVVASQPASAPSPGALDSAVRPTLSWAAAPAPIKTKYRNGVVWKFAAAGLVVMLAFVAYGGARTAWARYTRRHVVVPDMIAGMGRIDDPKLQPYVQKLEALARQNNITGKAAFYGFSGAPRFYFAAFEYRKRADESPADIFGQFARGYASTGQATIDLQTETTQTTDEATFICAKVKGKVRGSICMWTDHDTVGFVQTIRQDIQPTHDLTAVVRLSVET